MNLRFIARTARYFVQVLLVKSVWLHCERKALLTYLKCLQILRQSVANALLLLLCVQAMVVGFIGGSVVTVFLLTEDSRTRLWMLLGIFATLFILSLLAIGHLMSENLWLRFSGTEKTVERLSETTR